MRIGFIGAGRVGYSMAKYLNDKYHNVIGIYSKNIEDAKDLAVFSVSEYYKKISDLAFNCDTLFLTVNDDALNDVVKNLIDNNIHDKILIHTSGSISSEVFGDLRNSNSCYSLHPIYAFSDKYESYKNLDKIYFTLEGSKLYEDEIKKLFEDRVYIISPENKVKYHASCVMMSNMVNAIIYEAEEMLKNIGIETFEPFMPLVIGNINNIVQKGPLKALTGPVVRNDINTISKHLKEIDEKSLEVYKPLTKKLIEMSEVINNNDYTEMKNLLERN